MATPYYVQLPEYKNRPAWDPSPIQNALIESRKAFKEMNDATYQSDRMQLAQRADAREQAQFDQKQIAGLAQMVDQDNSPQRPEAWRKVVDSVPGFRDALVQAGQDPYDHVNGPKFVIAKARGYVDPLDEQQKRQTIATGAANEAYARSHAKYMDDRSETGKYNAETRRMKAITDFQQKFGDGRGVQEENWQSENRPGGLIPAAFGRLVPYSEMGSAIQEATQRSQVPASDDALVRQGFTPEQIKTMTRQRQIDELYGPAKRGYRNEIDKQGNRIEVQTATPGGKPLTDSEKGMAASAAQNFERAFDVLVGPRDPSTGERTTKGQSAGALWIGEKSGGWINSKGHNALRDAKAAAMDLSYFLSGKQIGNQEQLRLVEMYVPQPTDPVAVRQYKLERGQRFFQNLSKARESGGDINEFINRMIDEDQRELARKNGTTPPAARSPRPTGVGGDGWKLERID